MISFRLCAFILQATYNLHTAVKSQIIHSTAPHKLNSLDFKTNNFILLTVVLFRERYKHYLGRPDLKQELVSQWQKDFNSVADDMRKDEDTKAELHLRMDVREEFKMFFNVTLKLVNCLFVSLKK